MAQRLQAERELGAAAARRLGGSPGLRWPSVLHRPQHPANFMDRPERQVTRAFSVFNPQVRSSSLRPLQDLQDLNDEQGAKELAEELTCFPLTLF